MVATDAVLDGLVSNAYVLMRWGGRGWPAMLKGTGEYATSGVVTHVPAPACSWPPAPARHSPGPLSLCCGAGRQATMQSAPMAWASVSHGNGIWESSESAPLDVRSQLSSKARDSLFCRLVIEHRVQAPVEDLAATPV